MKRKASTLNVIYGRKKAKKTSTQNYMYNFEQLNNHEKNLINIDYNEIFGSKVDKIKHVMKRMN